MKRTRRNSGLFKFFIRQTSLIGLTLDESNLDCFGEKSILVGKLSILLPLTQIYLSVKNKPLDQRRLGKETIIRLLHITMGLSGPTQVTWK